MVNMKTVYAGLTLKNPVIVGASNLVTDLANLQALEKAGAAAVVFKSLFEEQVQLEFYDQQDWPALYSDWEKQRKQAFPKDLYSGATEHLRRLKEACEALTIPVIGSLNCISHDLWGEYAVRMAETGVQALELNFYATQTSPDTDSRLIEETQLETLSVVKRAVDIPVTVKLSPFYTNPLLVVMEMDRAGADAFVLFNRLFQPDIDVEKETHCFPFNFSSENDNRLALRYAGLLYGSVKASICSNTGIMGSHDILKMLLAGADAVQVVSAIYKKGIPHITQMLEEVEAWMERKNYVAIEQFKGNLSQARTDDPFTYKRAQYVDILMKSSQFMNYKAQDVPHKNGGIGLDMDE